MILSVYGGPGLQYVTLNPRGALLDQWYADHGFVVVRIDGRGTPGRGRAWERVIKDNLIDMPLNDQAEALRALARAHPELDLSRVGVYGWSFGGYFSAMAAMRRPDLFAAGVAGAPVCDWADYDTHYTERFLRTPQSNEEGYRVSNVLTYTKDLRVPLFVVHGTADDNVYFMHSLKMTDSLFRAGRPFDFLALPGFTHMVPDPDVTTSLYSRIADFFVEHVQQKPRVEP
jgi:dipeptidyl-peptidase-4